MNRKQKKELRQRQSTRQLMGIVRVTPHGIVTDSGERVFFLIQPDNLSVPVSYTHLDVYKRQVLPPL